MLFLEFVGGAVGALFGIPTGILLGITGGLLIGLVTRVFFFPLTTAFWYRWIVRLLFAVYGTVGGWICFNTILGLYARNNFIEPSPALSATLVPALLTGLGGLFIGTSIALWYEKTARGVISNALF